MFSGLLHSVQDYLRFNIHGLLNIAAGVFNITLGTIILLKNPKSKTHQTFFFMTFTAMVWVFCYGMASLVEHKEDAWIWFSLSYVLGVPFISPAVYWFSVTLRNKEVNKKLLFISLLGACLALVPDTIFTHQFLDVIVLGWGRYNRMKNTLAAKSYYILHLAFFFSFALLALRNFYLAWRDEKIPQRKTQLGYMLMAILIAYTGSGDFLISIGVNMYAFGYLSLTFFITVSAYIIIKHQFLDINLLLKRTSLFILIYVSLFAFLIPIYLLLVHTIFSPFSNHYHLMILTVILFFGAVLSLGPILYANLVRSNFWLKEQISTGLTHELKSPLGSIQGALDILSAELKNPTGDSTKSASYVELIKRNTERLELFVAELLQVANIQENKVTLNLERCDLREIIDSVGTNMAPLAAIKGIVLDLKLESNLILNGDKEKLIQVITNLLSNAIKFSDWGTIKVTLTRTNQSSICSVQDQGVGIDAKHLEKIFERFYQADQGAKGSGIGLTIAKAWVEAHGGKIWAESDGEGEGTKISFTLPYK